MSGDAWKHLNGLISWLARHNGTGMNQAILQVLKVQEEAGEAAAAVIGLVGQNPRKGVTHTRGDVAAELCDVALTALVAVGMFSDDPQATWEAHVAKVAARVGVSA